MSQFTKGEWHYDSVGNYIRLRKNEAILATVMYADTKIQRMQYDLFTPVKKNVSINFQRGFKLNGE